MEALLHTLRTEGMALTYARLLLEMAVAMLHEARALLLSSGEEEADPLLDWDNVIEDIATLPLHHLGARELLDECNDLHESVGEVVLMRPRRAWRLLESVGQIVEYLTPEEDEEALELLDVLAEAARSAFFRARDPKRASHIIN